MIARIHHIAALLGTLVLLMASAGTWWTVSLSGAPTQQFTGFDAAPLVMSLALASAAAYGAALLTRGVLRRLLGLLQFFLAGGAFVFLLDHAMDPLSSLAPALTRLTGLSGSGAFEGLAVSTPQLALWIAGTGLFLLALSGAAGTFISSGGSGARRFERNPGAQRTASDPQSTWDELSQGADPTTD